MSSAPRALLLSLLLASAAPAWAADIIVPSEDVEDRAHPEYDPLGIPVGSFTLRPSISATALATDNYRATHRVRQADVGLLLRPELTWRSEWLRHRVDGDMFIQQTVNSLEDENSLTYGGRIAGVLEPNRSSEIRLTLKARKDVEDRRYIGSALGTIGPSYFTLLSADIVGTKLFGDIKASLFGAAQQLRYDDITLPGGAEVSQQYRDFHSLQGGGSLAYQFGNGIGLELSARHTENHFLFGPGDRGFIPGVSLDRDSTGNTATLGINLELSSLVYGTIRAGYMNQDIVDKRVRDVSGFTYEGNVLWNVTPLTSLVFAGRRWVDSAGSIGSAGIVRNDVSVEAHHELYRNILLTARLQAIFYKGIDDQTQGREYHARLGARYKMNRSVAITGAIDFAKRNTNFVANRYHALEGTLGLRYAW